MGGGEGGDGEESSDDHRGRVAVLHVSWLLNCFLLVSFFYRGVCGSNWRRVLLKFMGRIKKKKTDEFNSFMGHFYWDKCLSLIEYNYLLYMP